jgi:hypothetical protein
LNKIKLLVAIVLLACVMLAACAPAAPTVSPTINKMPTQISGTAFEGLSSGLDNAKQARVRTVNQIMGVALTDVYVNGLPAFNGGVAQQNIGTGQFSGWLYVTPGTYTIALVPHGGKLDQALFPPSDVKVEAGHRYTVAAIGQLADKDVHPMVVDETALIAAANPGPTDSISIDINNLKGSDSITEECGGKKAAENIQYGEARVYLCPSGTIFFKTTANAKTPVVTYSGTLQSEPQTSFSLPYYGPFPAPNYDAIGNISQGISELNVLDFLAGFNGRNVKSDNVHLATFNTLLAAIDKAGLGDKFTKNGPYFFIAPTDEAFAKLSQADRDALLNDPQALANLIKAHFVDGYFPGGSLSGSVYQHADRTVTNELGQPLKFLEETVNGQSIGPSYTVGNGNRVQIIYTLLPVK